MSVVRARLVRRVLVAIDGSPGSRAAAAAAARVAAALETDLAGLFVEDHALVRLGDAAHAHQVALHADRAWRVTGPEIERQLRAQAVRARRALALVAEREGVVSSFRVCRGAVALEVLAETGEEDLVIVGRTGWSHGRRRRLGSTARALLERRPGLVLLLDRGTRVSPPPAVLFDGGEKAVEALHLAERLARPVAGGLIVLATDPEARALAARQLGPRADLARFERAGPGRDSLAAAAESLRIGLLVLPAGESGPTGDELCDLLAQLRCPVLVVR